MGRTAFLTKRGNIWWFRRRHPRLRLNRPLTPAETFGKRISLTSQDGPLLADADIGHLSVSLRTGCPVVARARAARVGALFEYGWQRFGELMNQSTQFAPDPDLQSQIAVGLLDVLKRVMDTSQQLAASLPQPQRTAAELRIDAAGRAEIDQLVRSSVPTPAVGANRPKRDDPFDDPAFVAVWEESTDGIPFWEESEEVLLSQFAFTLDWLTRLFEVYVRYCVREGKDPATAFKPLVQLAGGFTIAAHDIAADIKAGIVLAPTEMATTVSVPSPRNPAGAMPISEFATRFLDLRCQGYALERKSETPDAKTGASYARNSRRNVEATVRLFINLFGDLSVGDIEERHAKEFITLLQRIPANHSKSAKDRRDIRQVIADTDAAETREIDAIRHQLRREGRTPGEIEDAETEAKVERLRTDTCLRHMRDFSKIMDFARLDGMINDNPFKDHPLDRPGSGAPKTLGNLAPARRMGRPDPRSSRLEGLSGRVQGEGRGSFLGAPDRDLRRSSHGRDPSTPDQRFRHGGKHSVRSGRCER
ncbi:hypothetical protein LAZ40_24815 [Cereibacter sphaeroides]|uniref:hypothetical protein n=1 Tax=Cereibacter sphaeroides TaxID=1063 RepID=UPI001F28CB61|nr:hypothetical protein [Cereibacter sphaeroides]MCE6962259.1 hypothetical protein [Cereibacter sphaeroides]MCE6971683.1 hypothetical protein [Cereibacter sphaeroides]